MDQVTRINLWSGPRTVSTAVMYSFRERTDTSVVDEPLYAHYLCRTGAEHPAVQQVIRSQETDGERVIAEVLLGPAETPVRFFKQMAHHLLDLDTSFVGWMCNLLMTRHPAEVLPLLAEQVPEPTLDSTSLPRQVEMLDCILTAGGDPIVVDAGRLLADPEAVLRRVCDRLHLEWDPAMLHWDAGPKPEDGVWAPHWYGIVHGSTGFDRYLAAPKPLPRHLTPLLEECLPLYGRLAEYAI